MSFLSSLSRSKLYLCRAVGIGSLGAVGLLYLKQSRDKLRKESNAKTIEQLLAENKLRAKGSSGVGVDVPLSLLPKENRIDFVNKLYGLVCAQTVGTGLSFILASRYFRWSSTSSLKNLVICLAGGFFIGVVSGMSSEIPDRNGKKVCLGIATAADCLLFGFILSGLNTGNIISFLTNFGLTVIGLAGYAHINKADYNPYKGLSAGLAYALMGNAVLALFFPGRLTQSLVAWIVAAFASFGLVEETQKYLETDKEALYGDYDKVFYTLGRDSLKTLYRTIFTIIRSGKNNNNS